MTSFTSRYGNPAIDYRGAHIWAHCRHTATVLTVTGRIDSGNVADVTAHATHYVTAGTGTPVILDLTGVDEFTPEAVALLTALDACCREAGTDWALVPGDAVSARLEGAGGDLSPTVLSTVGGAEHQFDDAILKRRRMLLPLLRKTA